MTEEDQMPEWAKTLCESLASTIEFKGPAYLRWRHSTPDETSWGIDLIELSPAIMEIEEAGPNDGEEVFGVVHSFDLLEAQKAFDDVGALTFGFDNDGQPEITIEGKYKGREVVVLINFQPVLDEEDDYPEENPND
jgi:hypothetical protein